MSDNPNSSRQWKPIALVPVGLKEAALDSPTFRSSVCHFADQVDVIEKWLDTWLKAILKIVQEAGTLEGVVNGFLSQIAPPTNVSEAVVDHDYTLLALKDYAAGARERWTSIILGMRRMEANMVEPVRNLIQNDLKAFKETRRVLEQTQKAFDGLLYRYSAQARTKEPSSLREDAFQLHEARKAYLKASMDFSVMAPQLRTTLDKVLVKMFSDQWRAMRNSMGSLDATSRKRDNDIERVRSWSREIESGESAFRRDLQNARKQIEDSAEIRSRPSRDLEDYAPPVAPVTGTQAPAIKDLQDGMTPAMTKAEKQGWLYLRTVTGKPTRTVWVRRWFFVKNGIFGWLVQGSRSGGVEESDRIGVLLCNIRPAQSEERRFVFEVKTKDLSIVLQASSQTELVEWMNGFEIAKQKALEDPASTDSPGLEGPSQDPAFAISSPPAPEFAASAPESGIHQFREDGSTAGIERGPTLPVPGVDNGFGLPTRSSTDMNAHRRSTAGDKDGDSGRDHAARIIQKLDLHRKSTGGPQLSSNPGGPLPSSPALAGGGIASLIAASHNVMPVGPGALPQQPTMDAPTLRIGELSRIYDLPSTSVAPNTLVNAPAPTDLSAAAVIVSGERGIGLGRIDATGGMPSGVMANVWGSSNWGYLNRLERGEVKAPQRSSTATSSNLLGASSDSQDNQSHSPADVSEANQMASPKTPSPSHRKNTSLPTGTNNVPGPNLKALEYPDHYPLQLKTQDAQFRLLFPNVSQAERVVLVFRATWSLNEQQEFPGRVYVTDKHIYFYSHHLGLVLTSGVALGSISEVTAAPGRDYDLLFIHLQEAPNNTASTRVTVKAFLEPLNLLQTRLSFLVNSFKSEQPLGIEAIMKHLIQLEQGEPTDSSNKDDWGEFTGTATSDDGRVRRGDLRGSNRDLRAAVMFDGKTYGAAPDEAKDANRIKLPRQPVLYVPPGMNRAVVDKVFNISSKALFHLMFGDKSAVWQLLYHERHAYRIKQGSWTQSEQRRLRRDFEYQTQYLDTFWRPRNATVIDYQMIDVLNDHLCYVVTDRKTPWHLPYSQNFSLLNKIVITHHAKSKCRLAIYTAVDWTHPIGLLQGMITKRAIKYLEMDVLDLSDLVTDQVEKLGAQSRTKKAVQIFGQVGVQAQAFEFAGSDAPIATQRRSMKHRTVFGLLADSVGSSAQCVITSISDGILSVIRWFWKTLNANTVILAILVVSVLANVIFSSNGTAQWWSDRRAGQYLTRVGIGSDHVMSKAIFLRDVDEAWSPQLWTLDGSNSACRDTFTGYLSNTDMHAPRVSASATTNDLAYRALDRLQRSRRRLGSQRHDLIVALRVINSIEQEVVEAEWEGWLYGETAKCKQVEMLLRDDLSPIVGNDSRYRTRQQGALGRGSVDLTEVRSWHENYCGSCVDEQDSLHEKQARSSG